jgi:anaphase-promoting complex subunit 4
VRELILPEDVATAQGTSVCLARVRFGGKPSQLPPSVGIALLDGMLPAEQEEAGPLHLEILDAQFFDDSCIVIVYRIRNQPGGLNEVFYSIPC